VRSPAGLEFEGSPETIGAMAVASHPAGLLLGHDQSLSPVTLQMFRAQPTRIVLVDQGWFERVLVFRALALGARVVMHTSNTAHWAGFGESVTGMPDRFMVATPGQPVDVPASVSQPTLFVAEGQPLNLPMLAPWQAQLTVAPWFGEYLAQPLFEADLVILRRLAPREMTAAAAFMHIDARQAAALQATPADGLVLHRSGTWRYVRLIATALEQRLFGEPRSA
jgi:hypothetical protein